MRLLALEEQCWRRRWLPLLAGVLRGETYLVTRTELGTLLGVTSELLCNTLPTTKDEDPYNMQKIFPLIYK
ncbi:hypothetical protein E2C01_006011 [Portunus trituberculatus]|uniref:Uncharacterized protein n=1 Tax=Portunus trituberculatus TaxID=210409 RepID=A0A5B7CU51_PORTR|nr:hypothetical protein [Portunus trituberculatus]